MYDAQRLWWRQAQSDHAIFVQLRQGGAHECHLLHYLQMATEKLSKAYLWRSGHAPPKNHTGCVRFLKALQDRRNKLNRLAKVLGFQRQKDLVDWLSKVQALAYGLQNIAPAEAGDGPNPEYPWPHEAPTQCPISHTFALWDQLANTAPGRKWMKFVEHAIARFEDYA